MTDSTKSSPAGPGDEAPSSSSPGFSQPADCGDLNLPAPIGSWPGDGANAFASAGTQAESRRRGAQNAPLTTLEDQIASRVRHEKPKRKSNTSKIGGREKGSPARPHPSKKVKKLRGEIALAQHLGGKSLAKIAEDFGVSHPTIRNDVNDAIRGQLFTEARNFIQGTLVPKALRVIDEALNNGDTETARWVADKTAFHAESRPYAGGAGSSGTESFESWRLELVRKVRSVGTGEALPPGAAPAGAQGAAVSPGSTIDAEIVS